MTHRERVLKTFRFEATDRLPYDLMEGSVWPELMAYFRDERGLAEPADVLGFLDTDLRWVGMEYRPPGPGPDLSGIASGSDTTHTKEVSRGPLANARTLSEVEAYAWPDPAWWHPGDFSKARRRWPEHALVFVPGC